MYSCFLNLRRGDVIIANPTVRSLPRHCYVWSVSINTILKSFFIVYLNEEQFTNAILSQNKEDISEILSRHAACILPGDLKWLNPIKIIKTFNL